METESGFSRVLTGGAYAYLDGGAGKRDRLTGCPLDDRGRYKVAVTIEGVLYTPRFMSCGSAECIAVGANRPGVASGVGRLRPVLIRGRFFFEFLILAWPMYLHGKPL
ncbi:hypothetical protein TU75_24905 [Pseudomonas poae]|nr:hypothetical protein TU75_24905 [Pseudomonas poae]